MNRAIVAAMAEAGETAESLAAQVGVDPKTAARWASHGRIPRPKTRKRVAAALSREVADLWPDVLKRQEPTWFRRWADIERVAVSLRAFQLAWIPGLLQTEEYARATLAGEKLTAEEADQLAEARVQRQAVLDRDDAPVLVVVMDEMVLRRDAYGDRVLMYEQCAHIEMCARRPSISVHVVPASVGMYPGLGGPFTLAELGDGSVLGNVDSQARSQIVDQPTEVATLNRRWERIRGDALSRKQSLDLIREATASWEE
ncbi:DUF5753 domain-containing protein [Micromonospora sp. WMMD1082]|uniref:DUF5753 domain-containing protein n=1 Tax=Micromonospora sp. WMMD1082 TaxID=3016104 RepID=UPI0024165D17|nr:DUF5753 domain-containing protein [Micromonospora sp. WMMD1082]MDG4792679.1 DUF5753 domain-containing protein [Micromonospora sp. WMMD1082]